MLDSNFSIDTDLGLKTVLHRSTSMIVRSRYSSFVSFVYISQSQSSHINEGETSQGSHFS